MTGTRWWRATCRTRWMIPALAAALALAWGAAAETGTVVLDPPVLPPDGGGPVPGIDTKPVPAAPRHGSLAPLAEAALARGLTWTDGPASVADLGALAGRIAVGKAPTAAKVNARDLAALAAANLLAPVALPESLALPPLVRDAATRDGRTVAVPLAVRRKDVVWVNRAALKAVEREIPRSWTELNETAGLLAEAGIAPLAFAGGPDAALALFEVVALGLGGPDFYRDAVVNLDPAVLEDNDMIAVFEQMRHLRDRVRPGVGAQAFVEGKAAFLIADGHWRRALQDAGRLLDRDVACVQAAGQSYILGADYLVLFPGPDTVANTGALADLALSDDVQKALAHQDGTLPARVDLHGRGEDACAHRSIAGLAKATELGRVLPSLADGLANRPAVRQAFRDAVWAHFQGGVSDWQAIRRLVEGLNRLR